MADRAADFSIQSTQIGPVANTVSAQGGITDQSGEIIARAIAGAVGPAVELYGTEKEQEFKKEAEQQFRMNLGYTADPLGNQYPPMTAGEKEINQLVDRANQMGIMGAGDNAALVLATKVRTKIAKEPWFAERYKRAESQINKEYEQTVGLLNAAMEKAAANQSAAEKALAARRKEVYNNAKGSGIAFTKPIDLMTEDELIVANQYALEKKAEQVALDTYVKVKGEERAVSREGRAVAREGRAIAERQDSLGKEAFVKFNNDVLSRRETTESQRMTDRFYSFLNSGLIATNPTEAQRQFNAALAEHLVQLRTRLNQPVMDPEGNPVFLDKAEAQKAYERLEAQGKSYAEFIFGEKSNAAVNASTAKSLKDKYDLDVLKNPNIGRLLALPIAVQQNVWGSLSLDASISKPLEAAARGLFSASDKADAISNAALGNPVDPGLNNVATAAAIAAIDPAVAQQDPQVFNNFLSQVAGQINLINPVERPRAYLKVIRPEIAGIVGNLPDPSGATENIRTISAQMVYDLQVSLGPAINEVKYSNGQFTTTNPAAQQTADSLNGVMKVLEIVDPYGPIQFGSRDALAQKFFNVNMSAPTIQAEAGGEAQ